MALVLKRWSASKTLDENGNYVHLIGREQGLIAWILSIMGIDPTTEVEIKEDVIIFTTASLAGRERRVIPLASISSAYYGYVKPWREAIAIGILLSPIFIGLLIGPLYYIFNKTLTVGVVENSGWIGGFAFKRSVIEGKRIEENEAYDVIELIQKLIIDKTA